MSWPRIPSQILKGVDPLDDHFGDIDEPGDADYFNYQQGDDFRCRAPYARTAIALNGPVAGSLLASKEFGWILLVTEVSFPAGELEFRERGSWRNRRCASISACFAQARREIVGSLGCLGAQPDYVLEGPRGRGDLVPAFRCGLAAG